MRFPHSRNTLRARAPMSTSLVALVLVAALTSCGGGGESTSPPPTSGPARVARVELTPTSLSLAVGGTGTLQATPRDASGNALAGRTVTWTTSNAAIASVTGGTVTAIAAGSATVTAASDGQYATALVTVTQAPVASVAVTLPNASVAVRTILQAAATPRDAGGAALTGRAIAWGVSDTLVARVDATGSVVAVGAGTAVITATSEGRQGSATLTVQPGALTYRGLYTQFERRGFPNGYYSGDAIRDFALQDAFVPSLGLVKDELARQMDAIRALGVNTITFELRSADAQLQPRTYPSCNVSPSTGLLWPQPSATELDNLAAFLDLAQAKGLKVLLRLVNSHMDAQYRDQSTQWLGSILGRVKAHSALELVLFEGDQFHVDSDGNGTLESCGGLAEPPLNLGPDQPVAQYVQWAIGYARSLGMPASKLSAQAVIGAFVVDMELGAGANAQDRRQWHPLGVMKTIFDRLGVPEAERTYAVSFYMSRKCHIAAGYPCTDADPVAWGQETLMRAWSKVGVRTPSRIVAVEWGVVTPFPAGFNTDQAIPAGAALMRRFGLAGGSFWRWTNFTDAEDADPGQPLPIKWRGTDYRYTAAADALRGVYNQP